MYTQANRPLALRTPLGEDRLLLTRFEGETALSEPFRFTLDLLAPRPADIPFERVLGQAARVRVQLLGGGERYFHGIIERLAQVSADADFVRYQADLVPPLALLDLTRRSRAFTDLTTPQVLKKVLTHSLLSCDFRWIDESVYSPRAYCVQYEESDLAFAQRRMEEEGIFYFFEHGETEVRLVVTDSVHRLPRDPKALSFDETGAAPAPRMRSWAKEQRLCATKVGVRDYAYQTTAWADGRVQPVLPQVHVGGVMHRLDLGLGAEVHEYPGGYAQRFDNVNAHGNAGKRLLPIDDEGDRVVCVRAEAEAARSFRVWGSSDAGQLEPGLLIAVETTHRHERDGIYYPTRVRHRAHASGFRSGEPESFEYANEFELLPKGLSYRPPRRTPRPRIDGVQTAIVLGMSVDTKPLLTPETIEAGRVRVDEHGRVRILLPWDADTTADDERSCWVRVSQVWAGNQFGAFFWPRPGHEVVVAFENGDPDRPIIVGSVYNARNRPPCHDEPRGRLNGFKSASLGGNPAAQFNALVFDDSTDNEHVQLRSYRQSVSTRAVRYEFTSGPAREIVGGLPLPQGSGSGGGLFDLLPLFAAITGSEGLEKFLNVFPGKTSQVWGENRGSTLYGKRTTRCLGNSDNRLSVDMQQLAVEALGKIPYVGGLARFAGAFGGLRGANDLYFGTRANQIYWGPAVDIKRCQVITFKDASFFRKGIPSTTTAFAKASVVMTVLTSLAIEVLERLFANRDEAAFFLAVGSVAPDLCHELSLGFERTNAKLQAASANAYEMKTVVTQVRDLSMKAEVALKYGLFAACVPLILLGQVNGWRALSILDGTDFSTRSAFLGR